MKCKKPDGTFTTVIWKFYYPTCSKANKACNAIGGAYVAAVTVCAQRLF